MNYYCVSQELAEAALMEQAKKADIRTTRDGCSNFPGGSHLPKS
jgi:hypothetical protein